MNTNLISLAATDALVRSALKKAADATANYIKDNGEHPFNCGFAWVVIKGVRGKKAELLKSFGFEKRYSGPGLMLWNPSGNLTQDMSAKYAGARAFADVLSEVGFDAYAGERLD